MALAHKPTNYGDPVALSTARASPPLPPKLRTSLIEYLNSEPRLETIFLDWVEMYTNGEDWASFATVVDVNSEYLILKTSKIVAEHLEGDGDEKEVAIPLARAGGLGFGWKSRLGEM